MKITVKKDGSVIVDGEHSSIFHKEVVIESFNSKAKHSVNNCTFIGGVFHFDAEHKEK